MQVSYTTADGRMTVTVEGRDQVSVFQQIASFQEIFETPMRNIQIGDVPVDSKDVRFQVRKNSDGDEFYELVYAGNSRDLRGYKFEFGCTKDPKGGLFPKRKDKEGNWIENNGWTKWQGNKQSDGDAKPAASEGKGKKEKAPF